LKLKLNYPFSLDNQSRPAYLRVAAPAALIAGFSLRPGGVSCGPFAAANMGYSVGDDEAAVTENRRNLLAGPGRGRFSSLVTCRQVHGRCCHVVHRRDLDDPGSLAPVEADALLTAEPGVLLGILTADCLPLIMIDKKARALALVHAGWRGLEQGVALAAAAELERTFAVSISDILVYAGPAIGVCCFTVGREVLERFQLLPELKGVTGWYCEDDSGVRLNLPALQKIQLLAAGLTPGNFHAVDICTSCNDFCFSYRRDRAITGRQLAFAGIN
jgi:YfiH family protein